MGTPHTQNYTSQASDMLFICKGTSDFSAHISLSGRDARIKHVTRAFIPLLKIAFVRFSW
jgi:hypothetical protein